MALQAIWGFFRRNPAKLTGFPELEPPAVLWIPAYAGMTL